MFKPIQKIALDGGLERRGESRRFPLAQAAQGALQDEAVSKRVHITSLFGTDDLYYNPTRPDIGSGALVLCANVRGALWAIQADRKVRHLTEAELQQAHLVSLASAVATSRAEPGGAANPAGASRLQSLRPVRRVAELGSLADRRS